MQVVKSRRKNISKSPMFNRGFGNMVFDIFKALAFITFTLLCIFPFYYMFINTISDNDLVAKGVINFFPKGLNLSNYYALKDIVVIFSRRDDKGIRSLVRHDTYAF